MRLIGHLENEQQAHLFGDFLYVQGVQNLVELDEGHGWALWIHSDEDLERANRLLGEFRADPGQSRFRAQGSAARELREQAAKEQVAYAKKMKRAREIFSPLYTYGFGPVTLLLIIACVVVFVLSHSGNDTSFLINARLIFSLYLRGMPEILQNHEYWRLITPIFIHYGIMHILFNMMWLRDMGSLIERREGSLRFLLKVVVIAILSNLGQYLSGGLDNAKLVQLFGGGGLFGGMSGVGYGLFGYLWINGKLNPQSGYLVHPYIEITMLLWFFACFTGLVGDVANGAHTVGLLTGMAWGWAASRRRA